MPASVLLSTALLAAPATTRPDCYSRTHELAIPWDTVIRPWGAPLLPVMGLPTRGHGLLNIPLNFSMDEPLWFYAAAPHTLPREPPEDDQTAVSFRLLAVSRDPHRNGGPTSQRRARLPSLYAACPSSCLRHRILTLPGCQVTLANRRVPWGWRHP